MKKSEINFVNLSEVILVNNPVVNFSENNELLSVTIITTQSIYADALSTAVFIISATSACFPNLLPIFPLGKL